MTLLSTIGLPGWRLARSRQARVRARPQPEVRLPFETLEDRTLFSGLAALDSGTRPNFVFIITDDQDTATVQYMPRVQELLGERGVTFENTFVTQSLCCPSHVSILTGQYPHNHQILNNFLPDGGFQKFVNMRTDGDPSTLGDETTLATWLHDAGYLTGRIGKYLVGYPEGSTYVPPGWDEWFNTYGGIPGYFDFDVNDNGKVRHFHKKEEDYATDVMTNRVLSFLDQAETHDEQPFFVFFSPPAPHAEDAADGVPIPAPRHAGMFAGATAPRPPSFNEADVSDKRPAIQNLPLLTDAQIGAIDQEYQARLESLQAVDEGVARIVNALAELGELENTFIFFTSDNGYHLGQHRLLHGKNEAYEEDIRVPLLVRGPGVPAGVTLDHLALNIDFAPTITDLAEATAGRVMDGLSLAPLLVRDTPPPHNWRQDFLVEMQPLPIYPTSEQAFGLRTQHELYVEFASGARELYDLRADPYELENLIAVAGQGYVNNLSLRLAELITCAGEACNNAPPGADSLLAVDLGGTTLGLASGNTVWFDAGQLQRGSAAGWSWFTGAMPRDDSEFYPPRNQGEPNRMDFLIVDMQGTAHLLGQARAEDGVVAETPAAGTRPGASDGWAGDALFALLASDDKALGIGSSYIGRRPK